MAYGRRAYVLVQHQRTCSAAAVPHPAPDQETFGGCPRTPSLGRHQALRPHLECGSNGLRMALLVVNVALTMLVLSHCRVVEGFAWRLHSVNNRDGY